MRGLAEIRAINNNTETYRIVRFYQDGTRVLHTEGQTLEEAQLHCNDKASKGEGWFDGYEVEA
jgi:hypothetical protein